MRMRIAVVGAVAVVVLAVIAAAAPAAATPIGSVLILSSIAIFAWAAIGLVSPSKAQLSGRGQAVGIWIASIVVLGVGAAIMPEPPPPTAAELAAAELAEREREAERLARAEERAAREAERETQAERERQAAEAALVSGITFEEVNDLFGSESSMTEIQKDRLWESDYEGKCIGMEGESWSACRMDFSADTSLNSGIF